MSKKLDRQFAFFLDEFGETVTINNSETRAILKDAQQTIQYYNDQIIRCPIEMQTGQLVIVMGRKYLVISQIATRPNHSIARLRECNVEIEKENPGEQIIVGYNAFGEPIYNYGDPILLFFPAIVENKAMDLGTNQPIILPENEISVMVQMTDESEEELDVGEMITVLDKQYHIVGIDPLKGGLLTLKCELMT